MSKDVTRYKAADIHSTMAVTTNKTTPRGVTLRLLHYPQLNYLLTQLDCICDVTYCFISE